MPRLVPSSALLLLLLARTAVAAPLAGVEVLDGRMKAPVAFAGLDAQLASEKPVRQASADGSLLLEVKPGASAEQGGHKVDLYAVTLSNRGKEQAWLLVRALVRWKPAGEWRYFNGNYSVLSPSVPRTRKSLAYTMPMVAAYDGRSGLGLGFDPLQIFSHIENEVRPEKDGCVLAYGMKVVLDPGASETIRFVTFPFGARWGEVSAVAAYHRLFPEAYRPRPGTDPRLLTLGGAGDGPMRYRPSPEAIRRLRLGIDWCYAPVKIPGDWYGRPEYWDKYNENVADPKRLAEFYGTLDHWHTWLRTSFDRLEADFRVAPYFYVINWAYHRLAQDRFPEALITDPKSLNSIEKWVTNKGPDVRLFPLGNRAEEALYQDLVDLWRSYTLSGFGYDVAVSGPKHRGASLTKCPGRAWDDEGVYCDQSVAIARNGDFVHALPRKRFAPGFWTNGGQHVYSIAARSDSVGFEGSKYALAGWENGARLVRYMIGPKGAQLFAGDHRDHTTNFYDPETTSPEEIRRMYLRVGRGALAVCFRWGVPPTTDSGAGYEELMELVTLLTDELLPYGWQLVPGARATGDVSVARYGTGANTRLVLINPRGVEAKTEVTLYSDDCGAGALVFGRWGGEALANRVAGPVTTFAVTLGPGEIALFPAVADLGAGARGEFRAAMQPAPEGGWRLSVTGGAGAGKTLRFAAPLGCRVQEGSATVTAAVGKPLSARVWWVNRLFGPHEAEIRRFRFFEGEQPLATVVVPDPVAPEVERAAVAVREYFRFYTQEVLDRPKAVRLPVAAPGVRPEGPAVAFRVAPGEPSVALAGSELRITAPEERIVDVTRALLGLLDREYPFYGIVPPYVHNRTKERQARGKADLLRGMVLKSGEIRHPSLHTWTHTQVFRGITSLKDE